jgi:hypothetical protein
MAHSTSRFVVSHKTRLLALLRLERTLCPDDAVAAGCICPLQMQLKWAKSKQ